MLRLCNLPDCPQELEISTMEKVPYIIRGGVEGRERLRILARVMRPTTLDLLNRAGMRAGMSCLEVGCGGGDLAFDMARLAGPEGWVLGTDIDQTKLEMARLEAAEQQLGNVEFRLADITQDAVEEKFDLIHARFILTHLRDPADALVRMRDALKPAGMMVVEDIDFQGYFCYPECAALRRYVELYTCTAAKRGCNANIGPSLPSLLADAGFESVHMNVVQPSGSAGEVKMISPLTMENIADAVVAEGLASRTEIDQLVTELYEFANTPGTVGCMPRVVEAWGWKAAA
jgi:ubiquinone/menaquinone biosynthesis C-methylase UbiE